MSTLKQQFSLERCYCYILLSTFIVHYLIENSRIARKFINAAEV